MRIGLITSAPFPPAEGLGYHVWNLAQGLAQRGHHVTILTRGLHPGLERLAGGAVDLVRIRFLPVYPYHVHLHSVFANRWLAGLAEPFDVINEHTPLPAVARPGPPIVTTVHSPMRADTAATRVTDLKTLLVALQTPLSRQIEARLFARSARITTVAQWVAEALVAGYGVDPARLTVTGNGVEAPFLAGGSGLPREPFVLYAGRAEVGKGLEELVAAARIIADCAPDAPLRFVVAGDGPLLPKIQGLAVEQGVAGRFEFTGHIGPAQRERLVRLYRTAGIFTLPSYHEGMSTVMLEAMAAGAPVVSTAVGGALEVIREGQNGLLVPPRDPQALAAALLSLWRDPAGRDALGAEARATVAARYSWPAITEKYLAVYEQALADGR
ncbi:MAG TPA: glycosyltransferase family 4 protein [Anaerolineae bacterium]